MKRIFGPKWEEVTGCCKNYTVRSFINHSLLQILSLKRVRWDKWGIHKNVIGKPKGKRSVTNMTLVVRCMLKT